MKTERITILATPSFKAFLSAEAKRENISVAELVRARCQRRPSGEEAELAALAKELKHAVSDAQLTMREGLREANSVLAELRKKREKSTSEHAVPA